LATSSTNKLDIFYDDSPTRPGVTGLAISENMLNSSKYLSGIRFYSINDVFNISLAANNVYRNTFINNLIHINASQFAAVNKTLSHSDNEASGVPTPPDQTDPFSYSDTITVVTSGVWSPNARLSAYGTDPIGSGTTSYSSSDNNMVLTYGNEADDTNEYFRDEYYRLPSASYDSVPGAITGQWNSNSTLTNGKLQVWPNVLIYPDTNYTSGYNPAQSADYSSGFTGEQYYLRALRDAGNPHTNIIITFDPWNVSSWPYSNIKVEFKLPTQTGWLRGDLAYNSATFTGSDGDGCHVASQSSGNDFYFTFGGFSTNNSGYMIIMKITYTNNITLSELNSLSVANW